MARHWKVILLLILLLGIAIRLFLVITNGQGFFEPDNFYYYSVMKETLANNGLIPNPLPLSGIGIHTPYQEFPGLIYITLIPYWLMGGMVPLMLVMYAMPVIFGVLGIIVTYLITKKLFQRENVALLSAALFAVLPAAVYRTSAMQYRGESFVPVLLALFILWQASDNRNLRLASWVLVPIMLLIWKASAYVILVIAIAYLLMFIESRPLRTQIKILATALLVVYVVGFLALAELELSTNIQGTISEAQPLTVNLLFIMLSYTVLLAPLAWMQIFLDRVRKRAVLWQWLTATLIVGVPLALLQVRWIFLLGVPMAVFGGMGMHTAYRWIKNIRIGKVHISAPVLVIIFWAFALSFSTAYLWEQGAVVGLAPQLEATAWISQNTPRNATFLSWWSDGSIIEGWGNRTSYVESVNANSTRINAFARFILAHNGNYSYIKEVKPDYLFISNYTPIIAGIEQDGNLTNADINMTDTNLAHLMDGNVSLPLVYSYNGVEIYNVTHLWKT